MNKKRVYRIAFINQGKIYEVYAEQVAQGEIFGFVAIEGLLFGERSAVVVDPAEERLKEEFAGVSRFHVPMQAVIRIDEMEKQGTAKITAIEGGNIAAFPGTIFPPSGKKG